MGKVHITVVRHAKTEWNAQGRIQGHTDTDLSAEGWDQARAVAKKLASRHFDVAYSSDLKRTMDTAQAVVQGRNLEVIPDRELREWHLGSLQGLTMEEAKGRFKKALAEYRSLAPALQIPDGESYEVFFRRSVNAVESIARRHPGKRLLVVTHGGVINNIMHHSWGVPMESRKKIKTQNVCVITLELDPGPQGVAWSVLDSEPKLRETDVHH